MKKYLNFMALAMLAVFSLTFVSCSSDDDSDSSLGKKKIEINGKTYSIFDFQFMGVWLDLSDPNYNTMIFEIPVMNGDRVENHVFDCQTATMPVVGDDLADVGELTVDIGNVANSDVNDQIFTYSSGSAKIVSTNKKDDEIVVQFNHLKMVYKSYSYTYNGTVAIPFNFDTVN